MTQTVEDVMTKNPVTLAGDSTVTDAARKMREANIGPVLVADNGNILGIVTDRDIVVRVIAEGKDPATTQLDSICSDKLVTLDPESPVGAAIAMMKEKAIRRVPVVKDGHVVGIVSLGDLAADREPKSALGKISEAPPNT
jgi:CBS domain-containing protein